VLNADEQVVASFNVSSAANTDSLRPDERDEYSAGQHSSVESAVSLIESEISDVLVGFEPTEQEKLDTSLM